MQVSAEPVPFREGGCGDARALACELLGEPCRARTTTARCGARAVTSRASCSVTSVAPRRGPIVKVPSCTPLWRSGRSSVATCCLTRPRRAAHHECPVTPAYDAPAAEATASSIAATGSSCSTSSPAPTRSTGARDRLAPRVPADRRGPQPAGKRHHQHSHHGDAARRGSGPSGTSRANAVVSPPITRATNRVMGTYNSVRRSTTSMPSSRSGVRRSPPRPEPTRRRRRTRRHRW